MGRSWYDKPPTVAAVRKAVRFALEHEDDVAKLAAFADALETLGADHAIAVTRLRQRSQLLLGRTDRAEKKKPPKPRRHPRGRAAKAASRAR